MTMTTLVFHPGYDLDPGPTQLNTFIFICGLIRPLLRELQAFKLQVRCMRYPEKSCRQGNTRNGDGLTRFDHFNLFFLQASSLGMISHEETQFREKTTSN